MPVTTDIYATYSFGRMRPRRRQVTIAEDVDGEYQRRLSLNSRATIIRPVTPRAIVQASRATYGRMAEGNSESSRNDEGQFAHQQVRRTGGYIVARASTGSHLWTETFAEESRHTPAI